MNQANLLIKDVACTNKKVFQRQIKNEPAAERIKKKTAEKKAALEKKHGKKMDDHPEYPNKKYVDEADMSGKLLQSRCKTS